MVELAGAAGRLQDALERLERAVEAKADRTAELQAALDEARRENASLQETTNQVCARLDRAVAKLNAMLEA